MRDKYEKYGPDVFQTHQLVEMLLFHALKRGDTNPAAHNFLNAHPKGPFDVSSSSELCDAKGIGENSANLLRLSGDTALRLLCESISAEPMTSDFGQRMFLWLWMKNKGEKTVCALLLDGKDRYIDCVLLASGKTVRAGDYSERLIVEMKKCKAKKAILCHNHKNNKAQPSIEDYYLTEIIKKALKTEDLFLGAHYIVTDTDCAECFVNTEV